jgi:transposase
MGNPRGVKRDFDGLEARRLQAARLLKKGLSEAEVARQVGVHRQSVNRWAKTLAESGISGLKKAKHVGRPAALSEKDLGKLEQDLKRGPEAFGYETGLWTTQRVGRLIEERFGVRFHTRHVWWLLRQMGWSCQRPVGRALERDEEAIERWKKYKWPALKKKPAARGER